jgi:SNF2 family DNA or RNA helicase
MENKLLDLWSIFDFVLPGYLQSAKAFAARYGGVDGGINNGINGDPNNGINGGNSIEINSGTSSDTNDKNSGPNANSSVSASDTNDLYNQIKPFILRRLKTDVLRELPEKIDTTMYAEFEPEQRKLYAAYVEKIRVELASKIKADGYKKSQIEIIAALTRLRQICCHPALFIDGYDGSCGKLSLLQEVVRGALEGGHRILLFSQFTSMLAIIRRWADQEGISYSYIDGHVGAAERHRLVNAFNDGEGDVFLISLKAGGAGINLTGADTVIHYDPWWNPAVEDQATDRAYRIGQRKAVQVIKLLTAGSIEEKIYAMQERKKQLIESVIKPGETFLSKLSHEDLDEILSF